MGRQFNNRPLHSRSAYAIRNESVSTRQYSRTYCDTFGAPLHGVIGRGAAVDVSINASYSLRAGRQYQQYPVVNTPFQPPFYISNEVSDRRDFQEESIELTHRMASFHVSGVGNRTTDNIPTAATIVPPQRYTIPPTSPQDFSYSAEDLRSSVSFDSESARHRYESSSLETNLSARSSPDRGRDLRSRHVGHCSDQAGHLRASELNVCAYSVEGDIRDYSPLALRNLHGDDEYDRGYARGYFGASGFDFSPGRVEEIDDEDHTLPPLRYTRGAGEYDQDYDRASNRVGANSPTDDHQSREGRPDPQSSARSTLASSGESHEAQFGSDSSPYSPSHQYTRPVEASTAYGRRYRPDDPFAAQATHATRERSPTIGLAHSRFDDGSSSSSVNYHHRRGSLETTEPEYEYLAERGSCRYRNYGRSDESHIGYGISRNAASTSPHQHCQREEYEHSRTEYSSNPLSSSTAQATRATSPLHGLATSRSADSWSSPFIYDHRWPVSSEMDEAEYEYWRRRRSYRYRRYGAPDLTDSTSNTNI